MPGPSNNRRVVGRTGIERGALLFFKGSPARCAMSLTSRTVAQISDTQSIGAAEHLRADLRQFLDYPHELRVKLGGLRTARLRRPDIARRQSDSEFKERWVGIFTVA
jgi:hypothetical protein